MFYYRFLSKKKKTRASRLSVAIKVGTGIRKSRVHASSTKIVLFLGKNQILSLVLIFNYNLYDIFIVRNTNSNL